MGDPGKFVSLSSSWEQATGRSVDELLGKLSRDLMHRDDLELCKQWARDQLTASTGLSPRARFHHRSRSYAWYEWEAITLASSAILLCVGHEIGVVGSPTTLTLGDGEVELDTRARLVRARDQPIELTAIEFDLLRLLTEMRGSVVQADAIAQAIWGYEQAGSRNFLQAHISRLRKKLHEAGVADLITTVRGVGYTIR